MFNKYKHFLVFLYFPVFLLWFFLLEGRTNLTEYVIYSPIDSLIPFVEYFIIPYLLWFPYLIGGSLFFLYRSTKNDAERNDFLELAFFLISGMTLCLIIYTFFPSTLHLRPETYPRTGICTTLCGLIQGIDTPSNVCPSLHVYTSLVMCIAIIRSRFFKNKRAIHNGSLILLFFIICSTVFLKQHSILDVGASFLLLGFLWLCYNGYRHFKKTQKTF